MIMIKRIICLLLIASAISGLVGCSNGPLGVFRDKETTADTPPPYIPPVDDNNKNDGDGYNKNQNASEDAANRFENPFVSAEKHPSTTVALNAGCSTYFYFRNLVNKNYTLQQLQKCSYDFKTEEFLNYFGFDTVDPAGDNTFGIGSSMFDCPWSSESVLVSFTLNTDEVTADPANNFVFHIDVTTSMAREDVLPLFKKLFVHFAASLDAQDKVSIVLCGATEKTVIDGYGVDRIDEIIAAVDAIEVESGANGGAELSAVCDVARRNYIEGGNNQIIMISDGDVSDKLSAKVGELASEGIITSVLGFGDSNHRNQKLERIASAGGGRYFYIDGELRGKSIMGKGIFKPMIAVATNPIIKMDFDGEHVLEYRFIGYVYQGKLDGEGGEVTSEGKVYAGDRITVCCEVKLANPNAISHLKFAEVELEYTDPDTDEKRTQSFTLSTALRTDTPDEDMLFMSAVIKTVMVLQKSEYIGKTDLEDVLSELNSMDLEAYNERKEFRDLIDKIVNKK